MNDVPEELLEAGRGYERLFVPALFEPWTRHVLDAARVGQGAHVMDIACGTGVLARHALNRVGPTGRVVGVDPAPGMLGVAEALEPSIEWVLGTAERLEAADGSFDAVVSQFGMMFFEDRQAASDEMRRVLKRDGALAIAVWRSVEHNPVYAEVASLLEAEVSTAAADALRLPFALDINDVRSALESSGFVETTVQSLTESARFPGVRQMVEADLRGWLPLFDIVLDEQKIEAILEQSEQALQAHIRPSGEIEFPMSASLVTARKA